MRTLAEKLSDLFFASASSFPAGRRSQNRIVNLFLSCLGQMQKLSGKDFSEWHYLMNKINFVEEKDPEDFFPLCVWGEGNLNVLS